MCIPGLDLILRECFCFEFQGPEETQHYQTQALLTNTKAVRPTSLSRLGHRSVSLNYFPLGLRLGWFNHINNQINNNELNPINSNRAHMAINFRMGNCVATLFIKYHQEKKCSQNSLFKGNIGFNHLEYFFSLEIHFNSVGYYAAF